MPTFSALQRRNARIAFTLALALATTALSAQTGAPRSKMNVPFAFQVGSTRLPAGAYILTNPGRVLLSIQGNDDSTFAMSQQELSTKPSKVTKAVFHRYGNQYFLREVWLRDSDQYLTCAESKAEREAERAQKQIQEASTPTPNSVEVALLDSPR